jgi:homoserine kinase
MTNRRRPSLRLPLRRQPLPAAAATEVEAVTVFAPASVGNVGVGFDVLGHALDAIGDLVHVRRLPERTVVLAEIRGMAEPLPTDPLENTATAGLFHMIEELELPFGFEVRIEKGIPLGSGMGGSAASAVGAVVAANALLPRALRPAELLGYALIGERLASGAAHADNLAPGLLGGLALVHSIDPPDVVVVPVPDLVRCVLVRPYVRLDTRAARAVLPPQQAMGTYVQQSAHLAAFLAGCYSGDLGLIGRSLRDLVVEPYRAELIPGFYQVQQAAMLNGALGCSISGAGPSVFAWCAGDVVSSAVARAMTAAFGEAGLQSDVWISSVNAPGARIVEAR